MRKENIENKKINHLLESFFGNKNNEVRDYSLLNLITDGHTYIALSEVTWKKQIKLHDYWIKSQNRVLANFYTTLSDVRIKI